MQTGVAEEEVVIPPEEDLPSDPPADDPQDPPGDPGDEPTDPPQEEEEETIVSIGSEEPPTSEAGEGDSTVFADLRKRYRELSREHQRLQAQLQGGRQPTEQAAPKLRAKPTLEAHEFDAEKYEADLDKWHAERREVEKQTEALEASRKAAADAQHKAAQAVQENYAKAKKALGVKNYQALEDEVAAQFDEVQQSIVVAGAANPAAVIAALGSNTKKLAELASIKDPVKFAVAIGKLETEVKVSKRPGGNKPAPEKTVGGGSAGGSNSKATLERLEAEAARTGDRTRVIAYKRQLKTAGKT